MLMFASTHAALMAAKDAELSRVTEALTKAVEREGALLTRLADIVTQKLAPPVKAVASREPTREPDEVDTAIEWKAQGDTGIRRYLAQYARAERRKGTDPKAIAELILKGEGAADDNGVDGD